METNSSGYTKREETLNVITHGIGLLLSIPAAVLMIINAIIKNDVWYILSSAIYGSSLILLYLASTSYHWAKLPALKKKLKIFDHSAIYLLIAGTYTPFLLITLKGTWGWTLFGIVWGCAILGVLIKVFFFTKFKFISTITYVAMGWIIVVAYKPLAQQLEESGIKWLIVGGLSYTIGALLYAIKKIPYNHAIFHVFVLVGSFTHWLAIFYYVL